MLIQLVVEIAERVVGKRTSASLQVLVQAVPLAARTDKEDVLAGLKPKLVSDLLLLSFSLGLFFSIRQGCLQGVCRV